MRFGVLGPLQAGEAAEAPVGGQRLRALLTLLLLEAGRTVPTGTLIDGVYGADPPRNAANALQSQVSRLRRMLPPRPDGAPLVEFHPGGYRIAVDPGDVDVHRFTRLTAQARTAARAGDHRSAARLLEEALGEWRGQALADVAGLPFAAPQAARLEAQRAAAAEDLGEARIALGRAGEAVADLREHADAHPLRERAWALLIRALGGAGQQAEALDAFAAIRGALAAELGADPSPELAEAHLAVLRGSAAPAPPAPERWGLRHQFTTFVGREGDVRRVAALLGERRLVTVAGPGGAGKTRLAARVAAGYPGDAGFADLSRLTEPADIAPLVLATLELRESGLRRTASGAPPPVERLENALAGRSLLLVLDNCEHVVGAVAELAGRLLGAAPELRILATSREPLGMTGEALHRLGGLPLPPEDAGADPDTALESAAVRLFAERGRDADPGFAVTRRTAAEAVRICRRLDGLPLGIELAAARLGTLPAAEIAARLDDRFRLLSRGSRAAQPRHQTLRAVVEWSWDLLGPEEQRLGRRLSVFSAGADAPAIEAVCGADALAALGGLVDKSLVEFSGGRYRMLDTVHAFCAEHLAASGEEQRMRAAHAAHYRELASAAEPRLRSAEQLEWLAVLDAERDNLHAAVRRSAAAGDDATALGMVACLSMYWWLRGMRAEAAVLAGEARDAAGAEPPGLDEEWTACLALAAFAGDQTVSTADLFRRNTSWARIAATDAVPRYPFVYYLVALLSGPPNDTLDEQVHLAEEVGARYGQWMYALVLIGSGTISRWLGRPQRAEPILREAVAGFTQLGDRWGMAISCSALGEELARAGRPADGVAALDEALRHARYLQASVDLPDLLRARGSLYLELDDTAAARADFEAALAGAQRAGDRDNTASARLGLAEIELRSGDEAAAYRTAQRALAECPAGWYVADEVRKEIAEFLDALAAPAPPEPA
ncbi:BTAD domain-containing putative transcriptional regulator [Nocardiopsis coralliicola]